MCNFADTDLLEKIKNGLSPHLNAAARVSCQEAARLVARQTGQKPRQAVLLINYLVRTGFFRYVYEYGQTYLEKNYAGVVPLSERVTMAPPGIDIPAVPGRVVIRIMAGAAFGDCRHPTTRLSVRAIDAVLSQAGDSGGKRRALDIGTGSGILAITAAALGQDRVLATDIDPCARKEARENVMINRLEEKVTVSDCPLTSIDGCFDLIIGNLRPPTLIRYAGQIMKKTAPGGAVVLSGFKEESVVRLLSSYNDGFDRVWTQSEGGWCAVVLKKER